MILAHLKKPESMIEHVANRLGHDFRYFSGLPQNRRPRMEARAKYRGCFERYPAMVYESFEKPDLK